MVNTVQRTVDCKSGSPVKRSGWNCYRDGITLKQLKGSPPPNPLCPRLRDNEFIGLILLLGYLETQFFSRPRPPPPPPNRPDEM